MTEVDELLTYQEVAELARISVSAVRQAVTRGEITPSFRGRSPRVRATEYNRWVDSLPAEKQAS